MPTTQVNVLILFLAVYEAVGWFYLDAETFMKSTCKEMAAFVSLITLFVSCDVHHFTDVVKLQLCLKPEEYNVVKRNI